MTPGSSRSGPAGVPTRSPPRSTWRSTSLTSWCTTAPRSRCCAISMRSAGDVGSLTRDPRRHRPLRRGWFEAVERAALAGVCEHDVDGLADEDVVGLAADDVGQHPWSLRQLHIGDDVGRGLAECTHAAVHDGEGEDDAVPGRLRPGHGMAVAGRAERPRVPDRGAALVADGEQQTALGGGAPEGLGLGIDVRCGCRQRLGHQASSRPKMTVELPWRVLIEPPVPWARAISQSGTWTAGCASPRSWRTASMTLVIPPRFTGWLLHRPPPSVLNGSFPCGAMRAPSRTKRPPS